MLNFDWEKAAESDDQFKAEMARYWERNPIVFLKPDYEDYRWCKKIEDDTRKNCYKGKN